LLTLSASPAGHIEPSPQIVTRRAALRLTSITVRDSTHSLGARSASIVWQLAQFGLGAAAALRDLSRDTVGAGPPAVPQLAAYIHVSDCISPARWQDSNTISLHCSFSVTLPVRGIAAPEGQASRAQCLPRLLGKRRLDSSSH